MIPEGDKIIAGKYRLLRPLAEGGMGAVWEAEHLALEVKVAMKFMLGELADDPVVRQRFAREAKAAAKIKSPHITQIHDYGVHEGTPYMAMELLEGRDLDDVVMSREELGLTRIADIVDQLCRGLSLAHEAGIIHRDLKPSNVFLAEVGPETIVKVLDFGIAKMMRSDLAVSKGTESGVLVGSPRYMSPEQATGEPLDGRSDLWSVGVVIYELLTGVSPFDAESLGKVITLICTADIPPPSHHDQRLGPEVDRFFERAFERDPDRRFQSAMELADAFRLVASGGSVPSSVDPLADTNDTSTLELPPDPPADPDPPGAPPERVAAAAKTTPMATPAPVSTPSRSGRDDGLPRESSERGRLLPILAVAVVAIVGSVGLWASQGPDARPASPPVEAEAATVVTAAGDEAEPVSPAAASTPSPVTAEPTPSVTASASASSPTPSSPPPQVAPPRPPPPPRPTTAPPSPSPPPPPPPPPPPTIDPRTGLPVE